MLLSEKAPKSSNMADSLLSHGFRVEYSYRILPYLLVGGSLGYGEYSVGEDLFINENDNPEGVDHRILVFPLAAMVAFDVIPQNRRISVLALAEIGYLAYDYQVWWKDGIMQESGSSRLVGAGVDFKAWLWRSLSATIGVRYELCAIEVNFSRAKGWRYMDPGDPSAIMLLTGLGWSL